MAVAPYVPRVLGGTIVLPCISASPMSLTFSAAQFTNPSSQIVTVSNCTGIAESWSVTTQFGSSWLSASPSSGSLNASQMVNSTISINTSGLTQGTYNDTLIFKSGASTFNVSVMLTITAATVIGSIAWSGGNAAQSVSQGLGLIIGTG